MVASYSFPAVTTPALPNDPLASVRLFAGIPPRERSRIAAEGTWRTFPPGSRIVVQGRSGNSVYVILRGRVRVERTDRQQRRTQMIGELAAGEVIGEMGAWSGKPRSATAVAVEETIALELSQASFLELLCHPSAVIELLNLISYRVFQTAATPGSAL